MKSIPKNKLLPHSTFSIFNLTSKNRIIQYITRTAVRLKKGSGCYTAVEARPHIFKYSLSFSKSLDGDGYRTLLHSEIKSSGKQMVGRSNSYCLGPHDVYNLIKSLLHFEADLTFFMTNW